MLTWMMKKANRLSRAGEVIRTFLVIPLYDPSDAFYLHDESNGAEKTYEKELKNIKRSEVFIAEYLDVFILDHSLAKISEKKC
jgi:hypothetical protein